MQIVIDISDRLYGICQNCSASSIAPMDVIDMRNAIRDGVVLPNPHGTLVDTCDLIDALADKEEEFGSDILEKVAESIDAADAVVEGYYGS